MMSDKVERAVVVEEKYCYVNDMELTVHRTSMSSQGDGFMVYGPKGDVIFRADSYGPTTQPTVLMDTFGKALLTLLPKRPTLHNRWQGFLGEKLDDDRQQPSFSIWQSNIIGQSNMLVEVYGETLTTYDIEGCFRERCCTISRMPAVERDHSPNHKLKVAEIKPKVNPSTDVEFGKDVFSLTLKTGVDGAFAMGLVLALDRIFDHVEFVGTCCLCTHH